MRYRDVTELPLQMRDQVERQLKGLLPARAAEKTRTDTKPAKRSSKFNAERISADDQKFDSKLEFRCYEWLKWRREAGEVLWFTRQVPFVLEGGVVYKLDFLVLLTPSQLPRTHEAWDSKGMDLQASINKRKQVLSRYGVKVGLWPKDAATCTSSSPSLLERARNL